MWRLKFLIIILSTFLNLDSYSFSIEISDTTIFSSFQFTLKTYTDEGYFVDTDSIRVTSSNFKNITFNTNNYTGYAELRISNKKEYIGFIISKEEPEFKLRFSLDEFGKGDITYLNTKENLLYTDLLDYKNNLDKAIAQIRFNKQSLSRLDSFYLNKLIGFEQQYESIYNEMNLYCDTILKRDTSTFVNLIADFLKTPTAFYVPQLNKYFDNYDALLHYHFFDFINFRNEDILRHPALKAKIIEYFDTYCIGSNLSLDSGIDVLMKKCASNESVKSFVFNTMVEIFLSKNYDPEIQYLNDKYGDDCSIKLSAEQLKEFSGIVQTQTGQKIPDIISYDSKNNLVSLHQEIKKYKYTIVYVWMSSCSACQTKTPKLADTLIPYLKKGLGVFAISLDERKDSWLSSILKYKIDNWVNISELLPLGKSTILFKLNIRTTPKIFIVNQDGIIVSKDLYGDNLSDKLNSLINLK